MNVKHACKISYLLKKKLCTNPAQICSLWRTAYSKLILNVHVCVIPLFCSFIRFHIQFLVSLIKASPSPVFLSCCPLHSDCQVKQHTITLSPVSQSDKHYALVQLNNKSHFTWPTTHLYVQASWIEAENSNSSLKIVERQNKTKIAKPFHLYKTFSHRIDLF